MFKGLNQKKFNRKFQTEDDCRQYLYNYKWRKGFHCRRCGHNICWTGRTKFHARCTNCDYDESVTANTVFHKIQIPLLKAFEITFYVTAIKKSVTCRSLAKLVGVSLKSVWLFKRKVQETMGISITTSINEKNKVKVCDVDGIILTRRGKHLNGLQRARLIVQRTSSGSKKKNTRLVRIINNPELMEPCTLVGGRYVQKGKDILVWGFREWLTGTHHHCSLEYLQGYLDEYCFRTNHANNQDRIWHNLISSMMQLNLNKLTLKRGLK